MNDIQRMKLLSGQDPQQDAINKLREDKTKINEAIDAAVEDLKRGKQIDEGFFTSLKAALQTATQVGTVGAKKVVDTAKKVGANIKNLYLDNKAQAELKVLISELKKIIIMFDDLTNKVPTIMARDAEVKKEMEYFKKVSYAMVRTLAARVAVKEGLVTTEQVEKMLAEEQIDDLVNEVINRVREETIEDKTSTE